MARVLNSSLSYLGVEAKTPPDLTILDRAPLTKDYKQFDLGDIWLEKNSVNVWMLTNKDLGVATWTDISSSGDDTFTSVTITTGNLTLNSGNVVVTRGNITMGTGDLTLSTIVSSTLRTDANGKVVGLADPGAPTAGEGTVYQSNDAGIAKWGDIASSGNTVTITTTADGINLEAAGGTVAAAYTADDLNSVIPTAGGNIFLAGGTNIGTTAATDNTVIFNLDTSIALLNTSADGSEGLYSLGGNDFLHNYGTDNSFLGESSGNRTLTVLSATNNTSVGSNSSQSLTTGKYNSFLGSDAGKDLSTGDANSGVGYKTLTSLTTGSYNTGVGQQVFGNITTGGYNVGLGNLSGDSCTVADSSNILIGNTGSVGLGNTIKIGTHGSGSGAQDTCYIAGVYGSTVGATNGIVEVDSDGKLGVSSGVGGGDNGEVLIGKTGGDSSWQQLTAGTNITITPGANSITINSTAGTSSGISYIIWSIKAAALSGATSTRVAYDGSKVFVVIGRTYFITSDYGYVWTAPTLFSLGPCSDIAYGNAQWGACHSSGSVGYSNSANPTSFSPVFTRPLGNQPVTTIAYGNSYWVVANINGIASKTGSLSLTSTFTNIVTSGFGSSSISKIRYGNGYWVAVGQHGKISYTTDPTVNWTLNASTAAYNGTFKDVFYGNGYWVAVGESGALYTTTNPSGTWASSRDDNGGTISSVYYGNSTWCASLEDGTTIISNSDPTSGWSFGLHAPGIRTNWITHGGSYWLVGGTSGWLCAGTQL